MGKFSLKKLICSLLIAAFLFTQSSISLAQTTNFNHPKSESLESSESTESKPAEGKIIPKEQAMDAEFAFYSGDFAKASSLFAAFTKTKDKDFALWNNQLGSIYLAVGDYKQALNAFLDAYYLMNNVSAFSRLESRAVSLIREEREKAYKGDPYEKVYNSLYVALLLEREHDYDNALAAVKTGILCDSDVEGGLYKSDVTLLYLLAARFEALRNNQSMSDEYFQKAQEAYLLSHPLNRGVVSDEQTKLDLLSQKQTELAKLTHKETPSKEDREDEEDKNTEEGPVVSKGPVTNFSAKTKADESRDAPKKSKKVHKLEADIKDLETAIATLTGVRTDKGKEIPKDILRQVVDKNNNVLFVIELGRGPVKYPIGQYGHISIFTSKPFKANNVILLVNKRDNFDGNKMLCNNDVLYQALTRGGRLMDGILKGKVQFKQTTAQISNQLALMSQLTSNQSGGASAGLAVLSLAFAIGSAMANPAADVRHWSLLPAEVRLIPMKLPVGSHHIQLQVLDASNNIIPELSKEFNVDIQEGDNIIIRRIIE